MVKSIALLGCLLFAGVSHAATRDITLSIEGWSCAACAVSTRIALKRLEGVLDVKPNTEKSELLVAYDDTKVTPPSLIRAVEQNGYRAVIKGTSPVAAGSSASKPSAPASSRQSIAAELITLFGVPLECPAAKGLACGGRARPVLAQLEAVRNVAGAWVNYPGSRIAIAWKDSASRAEAVEKVKLIFQSAELEAVELEGASREGALKDFLSESKWYQSAETFRLTEEEAAIVAERFLRRTEKQIALPSEKRPWLKKEVAALVFKSMMSAEKSLSKERVLEMGRQIGFESGRLAKFQSAFFQAVAKGGRPLPEDASSN
jgi:cation transport ATPase